MKDIVMHDTIVSRSDISIVRTGSLKN